jgi:hypothetical protein
MQRTKLDTMHALPSAKRIAPLLLVVSLVKRFVPHVHLQAAAEIMQDDFRAALERCRPSVTPGMLAALTEWGQSRGPQR